MNAGPNKGELRIHRSDYGPLQRSLASPAPGTAAKFRRWNTVLIAILVFLVLGVFVAAEAPRTPSGTNAVQNANSSKSAPPAIHSRSRSGNLGKDAMNVHHAG